MKGFTLVWVNDFVCSHRSDKFIDQFHWLIVHLVLLQAFRTHKSTKNMWFCEGDAVKVQRMHIE